VPVLTDWHAPWRLMPSVARPWRWPGTKLAAAPDGIYLGGRVVSLRLVVAQTPPVDILPAQVLVLRGRVRHAA
jgi:hypothetical protein